MKLVFELMLMLLLISMLTLGFDIQRVDASSGTIYIRADGSIDPPTAHITTIDRVTYTISEDIVFESIMVKRDDIVIDGAGYTLQGGGATWSIGIDLTGRTNATVRNTQIRNFGDGILLTSSYSNSIRGNNITNNFYGIRLTSSSGNCISENIFTNDGLVVSDSSMNVVENNTVNGKPLVYLENVTDYSVEDAGQVVLVNCMDITVENLNLSQASIGVQLWQTSGTIVSGNNITDNYEGILLDYSSGNSVTGNEITNNYFGVVLYYSSSNSFSGNNVTANDYGYGIWLYYSSGNSISESKIAANDFGIYLEYSSNNSICNNKVTANRDYGILLYYSSNSSISGNDITNNSAGLYLGHSSNSSVRGNNITAHIYYFGIRLYHSDYNNIRENRLADNWRGIWLNSSVGNRFYHNNVIDNGQQVCFDSPGYANAWDNGYEGNYWSDCTGIDNSSPPDGIGDTPYIIDTSNQDNFPLMNPYWNPADINHDLKVDIEDIATAALAYGSFLGYERWNPHADITGPAYLSPDRKVDIRDLALMAMHFGKVYE